MRGRMDRKKSMLKRTNTLVKEEEETELEEVVPAIPDEDRTKFQKRIDEALQRSKAGLSPNSKKKVVEHGGVVIALDQDVSEVGITDNKGSLIGKDIAFLKAEPEIEADEPAAQKTNDIGKNIAKFFAGLWLAILAFPAKVGAFFAKKGAKVVLIRIVAPLFIVLVLGLWLAYTILPLVRIKMYIESRPVSVEKVFAGDTTTTSFDYENGTVPVKKEEVEKAGSDNTTATGEAFRGEKAEGTVTLDNNGDDPVTIPTGTVVTTTSGTTGLQYEMTLDVIVPVIGSVDSPVVAVQVGEEYNIPAGQLFSVEGYDQSDMIGVNNAAFSGGSKEAYTVFSKKDRDDVVKRLKEDAFDEAQEDLEAEATDGWELIESTIKEEVDGDPQTDVPVGAEADIVNVSIKTKSSALYFRRSAIEDEIEKVLTEAAKDQNLFESNTEAELELDQDVEQEITVEEVKGEQVTVKLVASSRVKPEIKKDDIIEQLKGKGWKDGLEILNDLSFATKPTEVEFLPEYFPEGIRIFPGAQGRILITIVEEDTSSE
jgi:hypothetical protein